MSGADTLFSPADLAALRRLNEANLPHRLDFFVPTVSEGDGGVSTRTYPMTPTTANVPCRLRAQGGLPLESVVAGAQGAPGAAYLVVLAAGTPVPPTAKARITGETPVTGADPVAWELWLDIAGPPLVTTYEMERKALGVVTGAIAGAAAPSGTGVRVLGAIVYDGNSIMAGNAVDVTSETIPHLVAPSFPGVYWFNFAVGGQSTTALGEGVVAMATDVATQIDPVIARQLRSGKVVVYSPSEIRNEITSSMAGGLPITARQALDRYKAVCQGRRLLGAKVIAWPMLPTTQTGLDTATIEAMRVQINAWMVAELDTFADALVELPDALLAPGANTNAALFADLIHPNATANALAAPLFVAALQRVLDAAPKPIASLTITPATPTVGLLTPAPAVIAALVISPAAPTLAPATMPDTQEFTVTAFDADGLPVSLSGKSVAWASTLPNVATPEDGVDAPVNAFTLHQVGVAYVQAVVDGAAAQTLLTVEAGAGAVNQDILDLVAATGGDANWPTLRDTRYGLTKDGSNLVSSLLDARLEVSPTIGAAVPQTTGAKPTWDAATGMIYGVTVTGGDANGLSTPASAALDLSTDCWLVAVGIFDEGDTTNRYACGVSDNSFARYGAIHLSAAGTPQTINGFDSNLPDVIATGVIMGASRRLVLHKIAAANGGTASAQVASHAAATLATVGAMPAGNNVLRLLGVNDVSSSKSKLGFVGVARSLDAGRIAAITAWAVAQWGVVVAS